MNLLIPVWSDRVSPVLDEARSILIIKAENGKDCGRQEIQLPQSSPTGKAKQISDLGVDFLICGAVSRILEQSLRSLGIDVISGICGEVEEVVKAFFEQQLDRRELLMPGCCAHRRRGHNRHGRRGSRCENP